MDNFKFKDLLSFDKMVATGMIKLIYWIGAAAIVIGGLAKIFNSGSFLAGLLSIAGLAIGLLVWRVLCELWIVIFSIHDKLSAMVALKKGERAAHEPAQAPKEE